MHSPIAIRNYYYNSTPTNDPNTLSRAFVRIYIIIYKLMVLAAVNLLPLLAWHNAMTDLFDKFDMPRIWVKHFQRLQLSGPRTWLWVAIWILTPIDILHALWCLAWYRELLHPSTKVEKERTTKSGTKHGDEGHIDSDKTEQRQSTDSTANQGSLTVHPSWLLKLAAWYYALRSSLTQKRPKSQRSEDDALPTTPPTSHPLLRPSLDPLLHYLLLSIYDAILIVILTLHIFVFFSLIPPLVTFCHTFGTLMYPDSRLPEIKGCIDSLDPDKPAPCPKIGTQERCERMNWNMHGAGGFSGAVAGILAGVHLVAVLCRIAEMGVVWFEMARGRMEGRRVVRESIGQEAPRDVDIHTRGSAKKGPGRLTIISEEEQGTGGEGTERGESENQSESQQSRTSSGGSGNLGDVLLECLVP